MDLIAGCGYVGTRLATQLEQGSPPTGLVRSARSTEELQKLGISPLQADLDREESFSLPDHVSRVLYLAPPPGQGNIDPRIRNFLHALKRNPPRQLLYISTTGVYGDCGGEWVDESRQPVPTAARALRRFDAENRLHRFHEQTGCKITILRVPGIYGPDRLPLKRLGEQQPMISAEHAPWTNRIHVDDLVQVCLSAIDYGAGMEVFNVSDGSPAKMTDYFNQVADRANLPRPPLIDPQQAATRLSAGMRSYLAESRRIDNRKMLRELRITLRYPTLAQGLENCGL